MKRFIATTIFLGCITLLIAKPTLIQHDTTQANQYYKEAQILEDGDAKKIKLLEQAIELYQKYDLPKNIISLKSKLVFQYAKTDNPKIVELEKSTIAYAKEQFKTEILPELGFTYWGLQLYWYKHDFEKSIHYGEMVLQTLSNQKYGYYDATVKLIHSYGGLGEVEKLKKLILNTETNIDKAKPQIPKNAHYALYYGRLFQFILSGNYQGVIRYGQQLLVEINTKKLSYKTGFLYIQIGNGYGLIGEIDKGIEWIKKGMKENPLLDGDPVKGSYYFYLGELHYHKKAYTEAVDYMEKAIKQYKIEEDNHKEFIGDLYYQLSNWHRKIKDFEKAETYILEAYKYFSEETYAYDLEYANILEAKEDYTTALTYIQTAIIQLTSTDFNSKKIEDNPSEFDEFKILTWVCYALKRKAITLYSQSKKEKNVSLLKLAKSTGELSLKLYQKVHQQTKGYEESRLSSNSEINGIQRILQDIQYELYQYTRTPTELNNLFKITERCKALSLLETLVPSNFPKDLSQKETQFLNNIKLLEQKITTTPPTDETLINQHRKALMAETRALEQFQTELVQQYPEQSLTFYHTKYTPISTIQTTLAPNELWIEYSYNFAKTKLYIYAIHANKTIVIQQEINEGFFKNIEKLQKLLTNKFLIQQHKKEQFIATSHQLYQTLIAPVISQFKGIEQLYVIPEGALFYLPFEVLVSKDELKPYKDLAYLIKECTISYHYSATTFFNLKNRKLNLDGSILAFAPVFQQEQLTINDVAIRDFNVDSLYRSIQNNQFNPLPFSEQEVKTIYKEQGNNNKNTLLLNEEATKPNLIKALTQQAYQFIHIATHGLVNLKRPRSSALACYVPLVANEEETPFLFANEILTHNIQADLVILSSCESGIGKLIQGEGLIALSRSFIHSGTNNVLFSLWKVHDKYSSDLMINFYRSYKENSNYATALRTAKLEMLKKKESAIPRYWAAFVLIGK